MDQHARFGTRQVREVGQLGKQQRLPQHAQRFDWTIERGINARFGGAVDEAYQLGSGCAHRESKSGRLRELSGTHLTVKSNERSEAATRRCGLHCFGKTEGW